MRSIAFGDIHEQTKNAGKIKGISDADAVIVTGDITNFAGIEKAKKIIDEIMGYNPNIFAQLGSLEKGDVDGYLRDLGINLHGNGFLINDKGWMLH